MQNMQQGDFIHQYLNNCPVQQHHQAPYMLVYPSGHVAAAPSQVPHAYPGGQLGHSPAPPTAWPPLAAQPHFQCAARPSDQPTFQSASRHAVQSAARPSQRAAQWPANRGQATNRQGSGYWARQAAQSARPVHRDPPSKSQNRTAPVKPQQTQNHREASGSGSRLGSLPLKGRSECLDTRFEHSSGPSKAPCPTNPAPAPTRSRPVPSPIKWTEPQPPKELPGLAHAQPSSQSKQTHIQSKQAHAQPSSVSKAQEEKCSTRVPIPGAAAAGNPGPKAGSASAAVQATGPKAGSASAAVQATRPKAGSASAAVQGTGPKAGSAVQGTGPKAGSASAAVQATRPKAGSASAAVQATGSRAPAAPAAAKPKPSSAGSSAAAATAAALSPSPPPEEAPARAVATSAAAPAAASGAPAAASIAPAAASGPTHALPRDPRVHTALKTSSTTSQKNPQTSKASKGPQSPTPPVLQARQQSEAADKPAPQAVPGAASVSAATAAIAACEAVAVAPTTEAAAAEVPQVDIAPPQSAAAAAAADAATTSAAERLQVQQPAAAAPARCPPDAPAVGCAAAAPSDASAPTAQPKAEPQVHENVNAPNSRCLATSSGDVAPKQEPRLQSQGDCTRAQCEPMATGGAADVATGGAADRATNPANGGATGGLGNGQRANSKNTGTGTDDTECFSDPIGSMIGVLTSAMQRQECPARSHSSGRTVTNSAVSNDEQDGERGQAEGPRGSVGCTSRHMKLTQVAERSARQGGHPERIESESLALDLDDQENRSIAGTRAADAVKRCFDKRLNQQQQQKQKRLHQGPSIDEEKDRAAYMSARGGAPDLGDLERSSTPRGAAMPEFATQKNASRASLTPAGARTPPSCTDYAPKSLKGKRSRAQSPDCAARAPGISTADRVVGMSPPSEAHTPTAGAHAARAAEGQAQAPAAVNVPAGKARALASDGSVFKWPMVPFRGNPCATLRRIWARMATSGNATMYERIIREQDSKGMGVLFLEDSLGNLHQAARETSVRKYKLCPDSMLHSMIPVGTCVLTKVMGDWIQPLLFHVRAGQEPLRSHSGSRFVDYRIKDKQVHEPERALLLVDESGDEQLAGIGVHHFLCRMGVNEVVYSVSRDLAPTRMEPEYDRKHVAAWLAQFLGQPVGSAQPPIELEGSPQIRTSRSAEPCVGEDRCDAEGSDELQADAVQDQDVDEENRNRSARECSTGQGYCDYEQVQVEENNESVHRFYILDSSGSRHLAAEGRKPKTSDSSTRFMYSPHPQFIEILPMRSGGSVDAIEGWIQRILSASSSKNFKRNLPPSKCTKRQSLPTAQESDPVSDTGAEAPSGAMKTCSVCSMRKSTTKFSKASRSADGLCNPCSTCSSLAKKHTTKVVRDAIKNGTYNELMKTVKWRQDASMSEPEVHIGKYELRCAAKSNPEAPERNLDRTTAPVPEINFSRDENCRCRAASKAPKRAKSATCMQVTNTSDEDDDDDDFVLDTAPETHGKTVQKPTKRPRLARQGLYSSKKTHASQANDISTTSATQAPSETEAARSVRMKRQLPESSREVPPPLTLSKTIPRTARLRDTQNCNDAAEPTATATAVTRKATTPTPNRRATPPPASAMALRARKPRMSFAYYAQEESWQEGDEAALLGCSASARAEQAQMLDALARSHTDHSNATAAAEAHPTQVVGATDATGTARTSVSDAAPGRKRPAVTSQVHPEEDGENDSPDAAQCMHVMHGAVQHDALQDGSSAPPSIATPAANEGAEQPETPVATPMTAAVTGCVADADAANAETETGGAGGPCLGAKDTHDHQMHSSPRPSSALCGDQLTSGAATAVGGVSGSGSGSSAVHKQFVLGYLNALAFCGRMGDDPEIAAAMATVNQAALERLHGAGSGPN